MSDVDNGTGLLSLGCCVTCNRAKRWARVARVATHALLLLAQFSPRAHLNLGAASRRVCANKHMANTLRAPKHEWCAPLATTNLLSQK